MIWTALLAVSFLAFIRQYGLLRSYQSYQGRRGLSGCELSRQLLDKAGFPQISVQQAPVWECFRQGVDKQLLLDPKLYQGRSLYALAQTAVQAAALSRASGSMVPVNWIFRIRLMLHLLVIPSWFFYAAGFFSSSLYSFQTLGAFMLQGTVILGIFEFSKAGEHSYEAMEMLKKSEGFEPDELVKLRALLSAVKWQGLAEIFKVPFDAVSMLFTKSRS